MREAVAQRALDHGAGRALEHGAHRLDGVDGLAEELAREWNLSREELDAAAPNNPVSLVRACGHISICNSRALALAGMERKLRELEIWIAEREGVVAGWGGIRGDTLEALYTAPEYVGQGVGAALLEWLEALMRGRGIDAVHAEASPNALGFYLRRGYRVTGPQTPVGAWPITRQFPG